MVDLELRARTEGRESLQTMLVGLVAAGGDGRADWSTARVREVAERVTGTTIVSELYARMAEAPGDVDLERLWPELGVELDASGELRLDEDAPLAAVRRAVVAPGDRAPAG